MDLVELANGVKLRTDRKEDYYDYHEQQRQQAPPLPPCRSSSVSYYTLDHSPVKRVTEGSWIGGEHRSSYELDDLHDWRLGGGDTSGSEVYCTINSGGSVRQQEPIYVSQNTQTEEQEQASRLLVPKKSADMSVLVVINTTIGIVVMLLLAYKWSHYLSQLHENQFWFSNIKEVEREISFRTEQGLYYSYFKQLIRSPSLAQGMEDLKRDNITEHLRTINIFHRFNIHPELFLAAFYRSFGGGLIAIKPILFYTYFVFALQGFFLCVMFALSWILSGSWLSGVLTVAYLVCHRNSVTRVEFTVALREHFSLPFIFAQFGVVGQYLGAKTTEREKFHLGFVYVLTLIFMLSWQFAQFVLLLQTLTLFGLATLNLLNKDRVCKLLSTFLLVILTNWYLQYYQSMVLTSLVASVIPAAIVILQIEGTRKSGIFRNLGKVVLRVTVCLASALLLNAVFKVLSGQDADNHIYRFVQSKFGYEDETDFETRLYLCLPIFQPLGMDYYTIMSKSGAMPVYVCVILFELACIVLTVFKRWYRKEKVEEEEDESETIRQTAVEKSKKKSAEPANRTLFNYLEDCEDLRFVTQMGNHPEVCYHVGQSLLLAVLAMSTLRMKCFWGPYICVFAGAGLAHFNLWNVVTAKLGGKGNSLLVNFLRHIVLLFVITTLFLSHKNDIRAELEDLREFYDPDTVELMEWINRDIPPSAAFTGSMQLLAGVKLCTGRSLTNHPHFEDKELRQRTKELYQIYGQASAQSVHDILVRYNSSFIILEDSICLAKGRCSTPGIMDLANGHIPDDGVREPAHLVPSKSPRFCHEIRFGKQEYTRLFSKVFENRTFRVYRVLPK